MENGLNLIALPYDLSVCKVPDFGGIDLSSGFFFIGRTEEEISLVCETKAVPQNALVREDGWRGFRVAGILDFSLTGILARISAVLAENRVGIFAVSTYDTDYILVKARDFERSREAFERAGYEIGGV